MIEDVNELEKIIAELDSYLFSAYKIKEKYFYSYEMANKAADFNLPKYKDEYKAEVNKWFQTVAKYLLSNFKQTYYYYHFRELERSAMSFSHPVGALTLSLERHSKALEEIILMLEERKALLLRQQIAEKEYGADILYRVTYSDHSRQIKINNILLAKPDFDSENDNVFSYIYANPNKTITLEEIEKYVGSKLIKRITDIVRDLGFTGVLRQIFFPGITRSKVIFFNPITKEYALKNDLPIIDFSKFGRQMEIQRGKKSDNEIK